MSKTRSTVRYIYRRYIERAKLINKQCPVCGGKMNPVWYSSKTRKCSRCGTTVRTTWAWM